MRGLDLMKWFSLICFVLILTLCAWFDAGKSRIPNILPVEILFLAVFASMPSLLEHAVGTGLALWIWTEWLLKLMLGAGILLPVLLPLYLIGAFGAGDLKLLMAVGGYIGFAECLRCYLLIGVTAALMSLGKLLYYGNLKSRMRYLCFYAAVVLQRTGTGTGSIERYDIGEKPQETTIPLAVPILIGTVFYELLGILW